MVALLTAAAEAGADGPPDTRPARMREASIAHAKDDLANVGKMILCYLFQDMEGTPLN